MSLIQTCSHCADRPSRRAVMTGFAAAAVVAAPMAAPVALAAPAPDDERFMRIAIDEARRADFPFGAVIVREGREIARGRNRGRTTGDPTAHGEMVAIRRAVAAHHGKRLKGATIYTSGEPCAMCMGAILWCGFGRMVYAASLQQLATRIDQIMIPSADVAAKASFAPIAITGGVLADEAMKLFARRE